MNKTNTLRILCAGLILALTSQTHAFQDFDLDNMPEIELEAHFQLESDSRKGRLYVSASIQEGWNIYSNTQLPGGPIKTKFTILDSDEFQITGPFQPDEDPTVKYKEVFRMLVEEHKGEILWSAPIEISNDVSPTDLEIEVKVNGQSCDEEDRCVLFNELVYAEYNDEPQSNNLETTYEPKRAHVVWTGDVSHQTAAAGDSIEITLNAEPTGGYKIYGYEAKSQGTVSQPTRIAFSSSHMWRVSEVTASRDPNTKDVDGETQKYYKDKVSWRMQLQVPEDAAPGTYRFEGFVGFQNCTDAMCDPPGAAKFVFEITVADQAEETPGKVGFVKEGSYGKVAKLADRKAKERRLLK